MIKKLEMLRQSLKARKNKEFIEYEPGEETGYIELREEKPAEKQATIQMRYCVMNSFEDVKNVLEFLRDGYSICIIKIKSLKEKDINELKRAIAKIKKVCEVMEGDVVGMDEDYLIASPSFVKFSKSNPEPLQ